MASRPPDDLDPTRDQPEPASDSEQDSSPDTQANARDEIPPDEQATRPIDTVAAREATSAAREAIPAAPQPPPVADDQGRIRYLGRLSPTELEVLRMRCAGLTTQQMAARLGISQSDAATHAANVLDKLGVTHGQHGTSYSRLLEFCPYLNRSEFAPPASGIVAVAPTVLPSQRAAELTQADDNALLAQSGGASPPAPPSKRTNQGWIIGGVLAFVLVAALVALLFFLTDDDGDDGDEAGVEATEEVATETAEAADTAEAVETPVAPTETPQPEEPTATAEAPTETPEPEPTATETPEPTATEAEATETTEPTATEEAAATETVEPTSTQAEPEPPPADGTLAYEADWSSDEDGWALTEGWAIEDGSLVGSGADLAPISSPFEPNQPDYAIEVEMSIDGLSGCNEVAGVFARITQTGQDDALVGYAGNVCADEWRIDSVLANDRDTLESGDNSLDGAMHTYRLEVSGERIRFYIDEDFIGEATDDRWDEAGTGGIYIDGDLQVTVDAFRIFTLAGGG